MSDDTDRLRRRAYELEEALTDAIELIEELIPHGMIRDSSRHEQELADIRAALTERRHG